jgi:tetratricopeptide (TPR) repeat protein
MDARRPCPDSALLAAFLDGALAEYERTAVVTHLAECAQCRAVALTVVEFREVESLDEIWHVDERREDAPRAATRVARWSWRKTRAPSLLAAAAVIAAVAASLPFVNFSRPARPTVPSLVDAAGGQRLTDARLTGGFSFSQRRDPSLTTPKEDARLISAAAVIRESYASNYDAPARRAVGVAALLVGDLDDAVSSLSIAALAAPDDAGAANDLAAAYYERALRERRSEDLPAALDAAERAVQLEPELAEAWFNRALAIAAMGFREEARDAWRAYQQRDSTSPWAAEARQRVQELSRAIEDEWPEILRRLEESDATDAAAAAVEKYPSKSRELFDQSLEGWSAAARDGADAPALRARLRALGRAFHQEQRERFYMDIASSVDAAVVEGRQRALAQAHAAWFEGRKLVSQSTASRSGGALRRARVLLAAQESPLVLRLDVEQATISYYLHQFDDALSRLPVLKREAASREYRVIATRAAWITGLAEYGRNNLAAARLAYEDMLALASLPGDVDQFVIAHVLLANVHDLTGDNRAAWALRFAAMPLVEQCETQIIRMNALMSAAGGATAGGHAAAALLFVSRTLRPGERREPAAESQARIQRADILRRLGRADSARSELQQARQLLPSVTQPEMLARREAEALITESQLLQDGDPEGALGLAERAILQAIRSGEPFVVSRAHLQLADAALANGRLDRADEAATRAIAELSLVRGSQVEGTPSEHELPLYAKAAQIAMRRGDLARAFDFTERRRLRDMYDGGAAATPVLSLKDIQRQLNGDTAVAVLTQTSDQLHIWVVTRDDVVVHSAEMTLSRAAALVSAHWQEISRQAEPTVGAELFEALFRPVRRQLARVRTLAVVADAPYNHVALAALFDNTRGKFLVEDFQIVSAPTATSFAMNIRQSPMAPREANRVAVMNAPSGPVPPPDSARALVGELATLYGEAQMQSGNSATPSEVLRQIAQQDIVHISAAVISAGDGSPAALLVADEPGRKYSGALSAVQLASTKGVRARIVMLDATDKRADPAASDGTQQLAAALIAAGVPTVVGQVGALPTGSLDRTWVEFHRHYAAGIAAVESLRRAQLAALTASNRRAGPWAALTVFGSNY